MNKVKTSEEYILNELYKTQEELFLSNKKIEELEENKKLDKEVIDKIKHILNNQINYREFVDMVNDIEDILKEVSERVKKDINK